MITLSPLEQDFIGDLAQDDHMLWEVFGFVRLHHPNLTESARLEVGRKLLSDWASRGWLEVVDEKGKASDISIDSVIKGIGPESLEGDNSAPWLRLTDGAQRDLPWLL